MLAARQRILTERVWETYRANSALGTGAEKVQGSLPSVGRSTYLTFPKLISAQLEQLSDKGRTTAERLRYLWTLHSVAGFTEDIAKKNLKSNEEYIRAWAIQLSCETMPSDALLTEFARMAREDKSPVVRLYLASALQRLPVAQRGEILEALLAHAEDSADQNLPLMYWYAAEPVAGQSVGAAAKLLTKTKIPQVREYITRRMTAGTK